MAGFELNNLARAEAGCGGYGRATSPTSDERHPFLSAAERSETGIHALPPAYATSVTHLPSTDNAGRSGDGKAGSPTSNEQQQRPISAAQRSENIVHAGPPAYVRSVTYLPSTADTRPAKKNWQIPGWATDALYYLMWFIIYFAIFVAILAFLLGVLKLFCVLWIKIIGFPNMVDLAIDIRPRCAKTLA
ncbi:hypothetical protein GGR54DRAFT_641859 [Hypoxylon sp. NC1633]|nr:hypothetical protein GGR54DRAFT_641859 [Hypoxylon sp. NC1633]